VDSQKHEEVKKWIPVKNGIAKYLDFVLPVFRWLAPSLISPTRDLGRVLTGLATGDIGGGKALEGKGVEGEGRTISNVGMRRLAGLD